MPEWGRFLNADEEMDFNAKLLSTNVFHYAANNPVNFSDPDGHLITPANVIGAVIGAVGGAIIGYAIANYFGLKGWARWACTASVSLLLGVVGWFAGPSVYAAIRPIIVKTISAGTLFVNRIATWVQQTLGIIRPFANKALNSVSSYVVKSYHLINGSGSYAKFNTASQATIRTWISAALRNGNNFQVNSSDSYYIIYNLGKIIGTQGERCIKIVFTVSGKIITVFPVK